jgi:hypothetical protein
LDLPEVAGSASAGAAASRMMKGKKGLYSIRWSHSPGQPAKVGSSMRMTDHEDAETVFV